MEFEDAKALPLLLKLLVGAVFLAVAIVVLFVGVANMYTDEVTQNKTFPKTRCVAGTVLQADGSCTPQE